MTPIQVCAAEGRRDLAAFCRLPWRIYKGDPHWVPPLISDRIKYLDPKTGPFYTHADVALLLARREGEVVGTIAPFIDRTLVERTGRTAGGFGFFETVNDWEVARALLDAACGWLKERGAVVIEGPNSFTANEAPGVLVERTDSPQAMLEAYTPLYYKEMLERYGMQTLDDRYAYRVRRAQFGENLEKLPAHLLRVAEAVRRAANVKLRRLRMEDWDKEIGLALYLYNETIKDVLDIPPLPETDFRRMAAPLKALIDPDLVLFAEVEGKPVGFCVAMPDPNRVLIHLNGRLFPFGWLQARRWMRRIDVVSFKLMGVLPEYRRRGIESLLYLEEIRAIFGKGYAWLEGSVTSAKNPGINLIATRLGAERHKHFRVFRMDL
jgi:GNAT superfamily N-acetyltransferase